MIGSSLAHYRITGELGAGGMGEVWRATDEKLGREVALKVLPEEFAQDPQRLERFEREAKVLASLNHPNIATLFGLERVTSHSVIPSEASGRVEGSPEERDRLDFQHSPEKSGGPSTPASRGDASAQDDRKVVTCLSMELVEGEDLSERIARGAIPLDEAIPIALQIAEALEAAHEAGIVHRDLKPANIKIRPDGTVKVLDFGLAKAWESDAGDSSLSLSPTMTANATAAGVILGTAAYMSPEQASGKAADRRADVWSFGVVLWEMLTGHKLFEGETVSHVLAAVLKDEVDLDELPRSTPIRLRELVSRCLQKKRRRRLQAIGDARVVLEDWVADPDSMEAPEAAAPTLAVRSQTWKWLAPVVLAFAVAIAAGLVLFPEQPSTRLTQSFVLAPDGGEIRSEDGLAVSPDGSHLVFLAETEGAFKLWIRALDSLSARPLAGTENATYPFWSPDGRHIGFFADGKLKTIPVVGGATRNLAEALEPRGGTWSTDGLIVYSPDYRDVLWSVPAAGGEARRLTELDRERGEKSHRWPCFLPGGQHVLFLSQTDEGGAASDRSRIEAVAIDGGGRTAVVDVNSSMAYIPNGGLLYWRGGSLYAHRFDPENLGVEGDPVRLADDVDYTQNENVVFAASQEGTLVYHKGSGHREPASLEWYSRRGDLQSEAAPLGIYTQFNLAPDGRRLAFIEGFTVWVRDLVRGTSVRVTHDDEDHFFPLWSPDGKWLVFTTNRTSGSEIRRKPATGMGDEELVVELEQVAVLRAWSPDGRYIAFEALSPGTEWDCWLYSVEDGKVRRVVATKFTDREPAFSPDGRWLAYWSNESGRAEVYVVPVDDQTERWQVSTDGGRWPVWGPSGSEIFFADMENQLMVSSVGAEVDLNFGAPKRLFQMPEQPTPFGFFDFAGFAVAPDGERLLLNRSPDQKRDADSLILVQNWPALVAEGPR